MSTRAASTRSSRLTTSPDRLAGLLSPLVTREMATIGAIEAAAPREEHPGYVMLMHETKTGKQANVEQMNTLLRMAGASQVESGGLAEPAIRLQTLALQKTSTTAMLQAMRTVQELLVAGYREAHAALRGFERQAMEKVLHRATKQWMILIAHVAQRKEGDSAHAELLPLPLSAYFATEDDRVCMRCLLDRPGEREPLEKDDPDTYVCAACHDEAVADFPPDLRAQMDRWTPHAWRDRVIHKALGRPSKMQAIEEVHAVLAGLEPEVPEPASAKRDASPPAAAPLHRSSMQPPADLILEREGAAEGELAYTDLLFDFRSVRRNW